ncbi:hypothetical protein ACFPIJ_52465 [Dactylosporangium cerinum]|uniref:Uncharacterized protein n=1 Tax=Dactylosporangium cerinum TaxID=1434730 RepID=A0ABV9WFZ8_9ACTN
MSSEEDEGLEVVLTVDPRSLDVALQVVDGEYAMLIGDGVQAVSIENGATGSDWQERIDRLRNLRRGVDQFIDMIEGQASRAGLAREPVAAVIQLQGRTWSSD